MSKGLSCLSIESSLFIRMVIWWRANPPGSQPIRKPAHKDYGLDGGIFKSNNNMDVNLWASGRVWSLTPAAGDEEWGTKVCLYCLNSLSVPGTNCGLIMRQCQVYVICYWKPKLYYVDYQHPYDTTKTYFSANSVHKFGTLFPCPCGVWPRLTYPTNK